MSISPFLCIVNDRNYSASVREMIKICTPIAEFSYGTFSDSALVTLQRVALLLLLYLLLLL